MEQLVLEHTVLQNLKALRKLLSIETWGAVATCLGLHCVLIKNFPEVEVFQTFTLLKVAKPYYKNTQFKVKVLNSIFVLKKRKKNPL